MEIGLGKKVQELDFLFSYLFEQEEYKILR